MIYLFCFLCIVNLLFVLFDSFINWNLFIQIGWFIVFSCWFINICISINNFNGLIINLILIILLVSKTTREGLKIAKNRKGELL